MEFTALIILITTTIVGFLAAFFTSFGTFIMLLGATVYALLTGFSVLTVKAMIVLLTLYLIGETLEYVFIIAGAKKFGASNKAVIGAIIGGILGAITGVGFFGIGIFIGTFLGIFLGAFIVELLVYGDLKRSLRSGVGGVVGQIGSIAVKAIIGICMIVIIAYKLIASGALKP